MLQKKLKVVMDKKFQTAKKSVGMKEIAKLLTKNKLSGVPIVNSANNVVGFVSERDIIAAVGKGLPYGAPVEKIMTKKVIALDVNDTLDEASQVFSRNPIRCIPVLQKSKIVGIISRKDAIDKLIGQYY